MRIRAPARKIAGALAAIALAEAAAFGLPSSAFAQPQASLAGTGELVCRIDGGFTILIGAERHVLCTFDRFGAISERYEGTTGLVTVTSSGSQTVICSVVIAHPEAFATLAGDYEGQGAVLVGGLNHDIILRPISGRATTDLARLNFVLGERQLHLDYAGRLPKPSRSRNR